MTLADIRDAAPREIERGILESGPFFVRNNRGGYFTVSHAEFHWYEEGPDGRASGCCLTREAALLAARGYWKTAHAEAA